MSAERDVLIRYRMARARETLTEADLMAQTGHWLRHLPRVANGFAVTPPDLEPFLETTPSAWGELRTLRPGAELGRIGGGCKQLVFGSGGRHRFLDLRSRSE